MTAAGTYQIRDNVTYMLSGHNAKEGYRLLDLAIQSDHFWLI